MNNDIVPGFDNESDGTIKLQLQRIEGVEKGLLIVASGYIDTYNSINFQKRAEKLVTAGFSRLVMDMSAVSYVSSTGVGALANLLKLARPRDGNVVLMNVQRNVYEVLDLLGFLEFFNVTDGFTASLDHFAKQEEHPAFPKVFSCPICNKRLRAAKSGRYRCSECKTILAIDQATRVLLG
jgi:anti-sigma B factor antagonist